jgi:hypothetical protein
MNTETPHASHPSQWQFSLRSLLLFTAALAGMLSFMKMNGGLRSASDVLFSIALLLPVWFPLFFLPAKSFWRRLRPLLALVPAAWYVRLIGAYGFPYPDPLPWTELALGYTLAALALAFSARGRRQLINVPLWLALLASAVAIFTR